MLLLLCRMCSCGAGPQSYRDAIMPVRSPMQLHELHTLPGKYSGWGMGARSTASKMISNMDELRSAHRAYSSVAKVLPLPAAWQSAADPAAPSASMCSSSGGALALFARHGMHCARNASIPAAVLLMTQVDSRAHDVCLQEIFSAVHGA